MIGELQLVFESRDYFVLIEYIEDSIRTCQAAAISSKKITHLC